MKTNDKSPNYIYFLFFLNQIMSIEQLGNLVKAISL